MSHLTMFPYEIGTLKVVHMFKMQTGGLIIQHVGTLIPFLEHALYYNNIRHTYMGYNNIGYIMSLNKYNIKLIKKMK